MSFARPHIGSTLSFHLSRPGRIGCTLPEADVPESPLPAERFLRRDLRLPELSQPEVVRYFTRLSQLNFGVDSGFYPLGSCSMKYNPKVNDAVASLPRFAELHPHQQAASAAGALALMHDLQRCLAEITGMDDVSLAQAAGAQGELSGILVAAAYHRDQGNGHPLPV